MWTPKPAPDDKVLVWRKPDGGMALTRIQDTFINNQPGGPEGYAAFLQQDPNHAGYVLQAIIEAKDMPDGGMPHLDPEAASWKRAWECVGKRVEVSMPKARDLHRDRMREARTPRLAALDVEMTRAFRDAKKQDEIELKRQELRDVTADPGIEKTATLSELKAVWPSCLK